MVDIESIKPGERYEMRLFSVRDSGALVLIDDRKRLMVFAPGGRHDPVFSRELVDRYVAKVVDNRLMSSIARDVRERHPLCSASHSSQ